MRNRWFAAVAVVLALLAMGSQSFSCSFHLNVDGREKPLAALERVVFIGASASSGTGTPTTLSEVFTEQLGVVPGPVVSRANSRTFLAPRGNSQKMVTQALEFKPTLVIAADFLFWFVYGSYKSDETRLASLAEGLSMLEHFDCPVALGTIPDMQAAAGHILPKTFVPSAEFLSRANTYVKQWAAGRKVVMVPVAEAMAAWSTGQPIRVSGKEYPAGELLQKDKLHPSREGLAVLNRIVITALIDAKVLPPEALK